MKTFPIWNSLRMRYCNPETVVLTTKQIALTTYISSILVTLKERQYEKSWGLIFRFKMFLEALGTANSETALQTITNCINQLYEGETKMVMSIRRFIV